MDDSISRKAAIDEVSEGCQEWRGIFERCKEKLLSLPSAQSEPQWIPVSERLPESKVAYYIVTLESRDRICDIARWDYDRRKGKDSWHWCKERKVIAWIPMPEPYQAERREDG